MNTVTDISEEFNHKELVKMFEADVDGLDYVI
jgi:hypothetical protein